ncbi:hypothetical protein GCM10028817_38970 [Spirosoma pomorum]
MGKVYGCHKNDGSVCRGFLINQRERDIPSISTRLAIITNDIKPGYMESLTCSVPMYASIEDMINANYPALLLQIELEKANQVSPMSQIKCTRCRHVHTVSDRLFKKRSQTSVLWDTMCPKCGGKQYQQIVTPPEENSELPAG